MRDPSELAVELKAEAGRLGFDPVGIAPAVSPPGYPAFLDWLRAGRGEGMPYLERHAEARSHPRFVMEEVRSVVMVALRYSGGADPAPTGETRGRVARYARGKDYHDVLWRRLEELGAWLTGRSPGAVVRAVADTAPLLERDFARLAGLGWFGKNAMLISRKVGSYFVLGALLADIELPPDPPHESSHCGTCTRCLDACPTGAFDAPGVLNAGRCLSYWTIEHRGPIPGEIALQLGDWAFGCDICQEVCPWNRRSDPVGDPELAARPEWVNPDLLDWLRADRADLRRALRGSAISRAKPAGLVRNAALVLGARRVAEAAPLLEALRSDPDEGVRAAADWALERLEGVAGEAASRV